MSSGSTPALPGSPELEEPSDLEAGPDSGSASTRAVRDGSRLPGRGSADLVRLYLQDIGRVDMLSQEEELLLARQVRAREALLSHRLEKASELPILQTMVDLELVRQRLASRLTHQPSHGQWAEACDLPLPELRRLLQEGHRTWATCLGLSLGDLQQRLLRGRRARDRMIQANLRLVVAVAKKYQKRGVELLDLVQEGTLGLERAVEKYDPTRGFRFSTYAYWWIRQGVTRAIATQSRTIRLPVHVTEKLNRIKKAQRQFASDHGRTATLAELAEALQWSQEAVRLTLLRVPRSISLEAKVGRDQDTPLGDLLEATSDTPEQCLTRQQLHSDLDALLDELSQREAEVIRLRFGLTDDTPRTLAQIGEGMQLSRERVRQIETRALHKLRQPARRGRVHGYLASLDG
ncbi:RNA polymerase sigma factor, RpoD/SigA family [Synechococcus sp. CBW1107]|uniref:RNA polymerase sigma factor, RpoD/SigA family n=1 Tax=unclassified Synechococcus TaxID=2626047 RepID=UPI00351BFF6D